MTEAPPADRRESWPVSASATMYDDGFITVRRDTLTGPDGSSFDRAVVQHADAVGVLVLDDQERLLLLGQYRHATGHRLLELPAGLLDVPGEDPQAAAARELAEEADLRATDWRVLVDTFSSPGFSTEAWRVFLVRGVSAVPASEQFTREHEEADLERHWVPLIEAVAAVLEGRLGNPMAVMAVLACWTVRNGPGYDSLRRPDADWSTRVAPA